MLLFAASFALLVSAKAQDILGVSYSFDVDFYRNFDHKRCDSESAWQLVSYEELNINPPLPGSAKGIRATGSSCASSFPIMFFNGTLEFTVYVNVVSQKYGLSIEVTDESDAAIAHYQYGRKQITTVDKLDQGWEIINIKINKHAKAYVVEPAEEEDAREYAANILVLRSSNLTVIKCEITIRGRSFKNDIVIIDSFQYIPNDTNGKKFKRSIDYEKIDEAEIIFKYNKPQPVVKSQNVAEDFQGSGNGSEEVTPDPPAKAASFWNAWTISLVAFGGVAVVGVVGAFCYCKAIATNPSRSLLEEAVEPARTFTLPRVTRSYERILTFD